MWVMQHCDVGRNEAKYCIPTYMRMCVYVRVHLHLHLQVGRA